MLPPFTCQSFDASALRLAGPAGRTLVVPWEEVASLAVAEAGDGFCLMWRQESWRVAGLGKVALMRLFPALDEAWRAALAVQRERVRLERADEVERLQQAWRMLLASPRFVRREEVEAWRKQAGGLADLAVPGADAAWEARNSAWAGRERVRHAAVFAEVGAASAAQQTIAVRDAARTLVSAGPGGGKTTLLVAKVAHLLAAGACRPERILVLAYTRAAAESVRGRLDAALGERGRAVVVRSFHGLAMEVLASATGARPEIAPLATQPEQGVRLLDDALRAAMESDPLSRKKALDFFAYHLHPVQEAHDFPSSEAFRGHLRGLGLRTLAGERVKSRGEWLVANWLFMHGIAYHYEHPVPSRELGAGDRPYRPDFFLPEFGVTIEHLGLDRAGNPPPFVDRAYYHRIVAWKRRWHAERGWKLVETQAWEAMEGVLPAALGWRLAQAGVPVRELPWEELRAKLKDHGAPRRLAALAWRFLRLARASGADGDFRRRKAQTLPRRERHHAFLDLLAPMERAYDEAVGAEGRMDFDGLIARATQAVERGAWPSPAVPSFSAILVDEAQDWSLPRAGFVRALARAQSGEGRLFAVGDPRQSIFHFAGADADLARRFSGFFGEAEHLRLEESHRMDPALRRAAEAFIRGAAPVDAPAAPISVIRARDMAQGAREALALLARTPAASGARPSAHPVSILLLARTGATLRRLRLPRLAGSFPQFTLDARTIHAAKGLEADCAVVLDLAEGRFPSAKRDDPVLRLAQTATDPAPFAEERRLFFVALTRARSGVVLVADAARPSGFVGEVAGRRAQGDA